MDDYFKNLETLNRYADGNVFKTLADKEREEEEIHTECQVCGHIPEDQGHRCGNCDAEISSKECADQEGFCEDCFNTEQWALKN